MFKSLFAVLLGKPLYHLFIAGPSQVCSRLQFVLAFGYFAFLNSFVMWAWVGIPNLIFKISGYPYAQLGVESCEFGILKRMEESTETKTVVARYLGSNLDMIAGLSSMLRVVGVVLAVFMAWRLLCLVIQRANHTKIPAVIPVLITVAIGIAGIILNFSQNDELVMVAIGWWVILFLIPSSQTFKVAAQSGFVEEWIIQPLQYAFAVGPKQPLAGCKFLAASVLLYLVPVVVMLGVVKAYAAVVTLNDDYTSMLAVSAALCNWTILGQVAPEYADGFRKTFQYLSAVYFPTMSLTSKFPLYGLILVIVVLQYRQAVLFIQRAHSMSVSRPWLVGGGVFSVYLLMGFVFSYVPYGTAIGSVLGVMFIAGYGLLPPRKTLTTEESSVLPNS